MITKMRIANKMAAPPSAPPTMAPIGRCFECAMAFTGEPPNVAEELEVDVGFEVPFVGPPFIDGALLLEFVGMVVEWGAPTPEAFAILDGLWGLLEIGVGTGG